MVRKYKVFQQLEPVATRPVRGMLSIPFEAHLEFVTTISAESGQEAIEKAKKIPIFKYARRDTLAAFPIVEETYDKRRLH